MTKPGHIMTELEKQKKREYRLKNAEKIAASKKTKRYKEWQEKYKSRKYETRLTLKESCYQKWLQFLLNSCKTRCATNNKISCTITIEDLITKYEEQNGLCAISKVKLEHKQKSLASISIDRIDNTIGYTKENVHLVAKWINLGRNSATLEDIKVAIQNLIIANS